tara:strand:- start:53 stop:193 length:141 start_codon:yes stop_codon:yes gene_type:complete
MEENLDMDLLVKVGVLERVWLVYLDLVEVVVDVVKIVKEPQVVLVL